MRRLRFAEFGPPAETLMLEEVDMPQPDSSHVRLRMTHRPINPSDLLTIAGQYGRLPRLPATPGLEGVGTIDALGPGMSGLEIGQRVIPLGAGGGTWSEYILADAARLLPVPETISNQTAAQFVVNPVTAWVMLENVLGIEADEWVLQTAAGSTLGRVVLQLAQLRGFKTVNFVRRREQVAELEALGADAVFCTEEEDIVTRVQAITGGKGVKGAIEAVGGATGDLALQCVRPGGTMLVYGLLSGEPIPLHSGEMLFRGLTVSGFWLSHWFQATPPGEIVEAVTALMGYMAAGDLVPPVEAEYDLADYVAAVTHAETPGRQGKVLLAG